MIPDHKFSTSYAKIYACDLTSLLKFFIEIYPNWSVKPLILEIIHETAVDVDNDLENETPIQKFNNSLIEQYDQIDKIRSNHNTEAEEFEDMGSLEDSYSSEISEKSAMIKQIKLMQQKLDLLNTIQNQKKSLIEKDTKISQLESYVDQICMKIIDFDPTLLQKYGAF